MKNRIFTAALFLLLSLSLIAQKPVARIAFWNVENLFDTINDPNINDEEFLPSAKDHWTSDRYLAKINHLAQGILAIGDGAGPDILGMAEVENEGVLKDLTQKTDLKKQKYGIVHYDSPDKRGIDVAMLYKKSKFKVLDSRPVNVSVPADTFFTRDILVVKGILNKTDTVWIIVNHWPSRRGGAEASESKRMIASRKLQGILDSIMKMNPRSLVLAMGDFNDEPTNNSIMNLKCNDWLDPAMQQKLDTLNKIIGESIDNQGAGWMMAPSQNCFHDLMDSLKDAGDGSYHYRKEKDMIDQFLVNGNLYGTGYRITVHSAHIFKADFLTGENYKSDPPGPLHTYAGSRYIGGYSDHYPVYADVVTTGKK
ncbi:MAG TPA: endonuclease/exonuclease/phosphatase family protein [Bacteroidia bacterium]|nr:endonuclease/exonuclease/phosphatase family protein [Bacteroidia bacterium]